MKRRGKGFWKEGKERKDKIFLCEKNKENQRERERERERERGGSNLIDQKRGIGSFCGRKKREKLKEF